MPHLGRPAAGAVTVILLATTGPLLLAPSAGAATSCASPVFKRLFYANTSFSGTPKRTDCDSVIAQNWGSGAPVSGLPKSGFGVRWSVTRDFGSGGPFTFTASALDGVRVYLDGIRKIDLWKNGSTTVKKTVDVTVPKGTHTLRVDYVNWTGNAAVSFSYAPRTSPTVDTVAPLTPGSPKVAYSTTTGAAKFSWARGKEMDLAGYHVYRRPKGASYPAKPAATVAATASTTAWTDSTLPLDGAV
ncbi:PA14 domain-containing protein [Streptomyces sp. NPDC008150]|uniref:PA14 domain-containing protein n=1 Tax=Streptomyces sp. NPDC008150 TaxID=3364816 RepID=UPI0036E3AE2B